MAMCRRSLFRVLFASLLAGLTVTCCASPALANGPVFARCLKVAPEGKAYHGNFTTSKCSSTSTTKTGKYEGYLGAEGAELTLTAGKVTFESHTKAQITCSAASGVGEVTGAHFLGDITLNFSGCESAGLKCATEEAKEEVIATPVLVGALGFEKGGPKPKTALELRTGSASEPFFEASCGGVAVKVRGAVLVPVKASKASTKLSLKFDGKGGIQKPEQFEGGANRHLEISYGGGAFERADLDGGLSAVSAIAYDIYPYEPHLLELFVPETFHTNAGTLEYSSGFVTDHSECCGGGYVAGGYQVFAMEEASVVCTYANATVTVPTGNLSTLAVKPRLHNCNLYFFGNAETKFPSSPYPIEGEPEPDYVYTGSEKLELKQKLVFHEPVHHCTLEVEPHTWPATYLNDNSFMGADVGSVFYSSEPMFYEWTEDCAGLLEPVGTVTLPDEFFDGTGKIKFE